MSWIKQLQSDTDEAETPKTYIYWAGISIIGAIVSPNVRINCGGIYKLQPNPFIMLIGESGLGKGLPIAIARRLVSIVGTTRVIIGSNTIQHIIQELGNSETDQNTGVPKWKDSRAYIVSGEFTNILDDDKKAISTLTEWYDTHYVEDWKRGTKSSGKYNLEGLCVSLFAGSTPEHFQNTVPEHDVKGGFVGRLLTVYEEKRSKVNPLSDTDIEIELPYQKWAQHLFEISQLTGNFHWQDLRTKKLWEDWYSSVRTPKKKINDPTGAINRLPDNVRKVAMCISLSRQSKELLISYEDLDEAISKCMELTIDSRRLTGGKGPSQIGGQVHFVTQVLYRAALEDEKITKSRLLKDYYGHFDLFELDRIISTLETADMIECIPINDTRADVLIRMTPNTVISIQKYMERT